MTEPTLDNQIAEGESPRPAWQERMPLLIVAGIGAVLVVGLGAWFLLAGSGDDGGSLAVKPAPRSSAVVATPGATPAEASTVPAKVENLGLARDPFEDLYPPKVEAPAQTEAPAPATPELPAVPNVPLPEQPQPQVPAAPVAAEVKITVVGIDFGRERVKVVVDGGAPVWMAIDDRTSSTPQVTLYDFNEERGGVATFYVGDDPGDAVDIRKGKSHTFR